VLVAELVATSEELPVETVPHALLFQEEIQHIHLIAVASESIAGVDILASGLTSRIGELQALKPGYIVPVG